MPKWWIRGEEGWVWNENKCLNDLDKQRWAIFESVRACHATMGSIVEENLDRRIRTMLEEPCSGRDVYIVIQCLLD